MGCDAYANEVGQFILEIRSYDTGKVLAVVKVEDLAPKERIGVEYIEGDPR